MIKIIILTFAILSFGMMMSFLWSLWFPRTRCMAILFNSDDKHNACIRNKSHSGSHVTANSKVLSRRK